MYCRRGTERPGGLLRYIFLLAYINNLDILADMNTQDYTLMMQDRSGRVAAIPVIGASIDDLVSDNYSQDEAAECVESNALQNAIARNEIGDDAWLIQRT